MQLALTCIVVFMAKIVEISIQSIKTVCMVKSEKLLAAVLGFIECMIWGLVISSIITDLSSSGFLLVSYGLGYSCGMYLGSCIEGKLALGTSSIQMIMDDSHIEKVEAYLKEHNNGYFCNEGHGSKENMFHIIVILPRKSVRKTMKEIKELCEGKVFMVTSEVSKFTGGYGAAK